MGKGLLSLQVKSSRTAESANSVLFLPEFGPEQGARHYRNEKEEESKDTVVGLCPATEQQCDLLQALGLGFTHCEMGTAVLPCRELVTLGETVMLRACLRAGDVLGERCKVISFLHFPLPWGRIGRTSAEFEKCFSLSSPPPLPAPNQDSTDHFPSHPPQYQVPTP